MTASHHNTLHLIEVLGLRAVALEKQGKAEEALTILERAVTLARPGGFIFPFVEIGAPMADLLKRLFEQNFASDYIEKLLVNCRGDEQAVVPEAADNATASLHLPVSQSLSPPISKSPQPLVDPLTHREIDVLELLAQRFQNKAIAAKLFVAPETVKAHLNNIYQKLRVGNRRQAVEKAKKLRILSGGI